MLINKKDANKKSLATNALLSSLKTLTTIIFPLITYPYISRILDVENIGRVNFGMSIVSYFSLLGALGLNAFAIRNGSQIRNDLKRINRFANRVFTINILATLLSCALLIFTLFLPTKIAKYRDIILIQGITVALAPFAVDWIYTIYEDFGYITLRSFCVHLLSLILMFCFVKRESDIYLYVALTTISTSLGNLFNFFHAKKYIRLSLVRETGWKEYRGSVMLFFVNSIASIIYLNSDTTLLGLMCDDRAVGLYSVATKIYSIIKQMFNAIIASTIPRLAYLRKNDIKAFINLIKWIFDMASFFIFPVAFGIIILRKEIIVLISGQKYMAASTTLGIFAGCIVFAVMANILANGLLICLGKEEFVLRATLLSAFINVALNFVFIPWLSQNGAAITTLIAEIIVVSVSIYYARDYAKDVIDFSELGKSAIGSMVMFLITGVLANGVISQYGLAFRIIVSVVLSVFVYAGTMILIRDRVALYLIKTVREKVGGKMRK